MKGKYIQDLAQSVSLDMRKQKRAGERRLSLEVQMNQSLHMAALNGHREIPDSLSLLHVRVPVPAGRYQGGQCEMYLEMEVARACFCFTAVSGRTIIHCLWLEVGKAHVKGGETTDLEICTSAHGMFHMSMPFAYKVRGSYGLMRGKPNYTLYNLLRTIYSIQWFFYWSQKKFPHGTGQPCISHQSIGSP